jgi:hypothetical protein
VFSKSRSIPRRISIANSDISFLFHLDCQYSFRNPNEPLEVLALTENNAEGKKKFISTVRVNCSEDENLVVENWQYLDAYGQWHNGEGSVFSVDFKTVGGRNGNKKDLTFLKVKKYMKNTVFRLM